MDNAAVYWLIFATSISSLTTTVFYLFQKCCGNFWTNVSNVCFQNFAACLGLREETFHEVTNLCTIPRIFEQLHLHTFKVMWIHDANAQTGDCVQWGWFRLPTKSYALAFLAVCGVTHYVYIPSDLKSVEIVGPTEGIAKLIELSNVAATVRLSLAQLDSLRDSFGMEDAWTTADKICTRWERRFAFCMLSACCVGMGCVLQIGKAGIMTAMLGSAVVCCAVQLARRQQLQHRMRRFLTHRLSFHFPWRRHPLDVTGGHVQLIVANPPDSSESPTENAVERSGSVARAGRQEPDSTELSTEDAVEPLLYSTLLPHGYYYEVVKQTEVVCVQNEVLVRFEQTAQMYAVVLQPNFMHHLAERTEIPNDSSLHVCIHNPMIDPPLIELYQNFQKGVNRENLLMIILPPLVRFNSCFQAPLLPRTRSAKCTQFVTTLCDFETLLLHMTGTFTPKLVFVFPIDENTYNEHLQTPFDVWVSSERVLGEQNCHWASTRAPM